MDSNSLQQHQPLRASLRSGLGFFKSIVLVCRKRELISVIKTNNMSNGEFANVSDSSSSCKMAVAEAPTRCVLSTTRHRPFPAVQDPSTLGGRLKNHTSYRSHRLCQEEALWEKSSAADNLEQRRVSGISYLTGSATQRKDADADGLCRSKRVSRRFPHTSRATAGAFAPASGKHPTRRHLNQSRKI